MIDKLKLDDKIENVYKLNINNFDSELVIHGNNKYILTENEVYHIESLASFIPIDNKYILLSDSSKLEINEDIYKMIEPLFS